MCAFAAVSWCQSKYYVATTGSDSTGNGSSSSPWATIAKAVQSVPDNGSEIVVRNGTYGQTILSRKFSKIATIRAENAYQAKIRSADALAVMLYYARNIELSGFDIARTNPSSSNPLLVKVAGGDNLILRNNILHESYNNDLLKVNEGTRNFLVIGNVFRNQHGVAGQHIDINGCVDVTVRENIFFNDAAAAGIPASTINQTHGFIVVKNSSGYQDYPESRRVRIANNVFLNFQGSAGSNFVLLGEDGYSYYEIEDVMVENNLMLGNSSTPMRAPLGVKGARKVVFRNNTVAGDLPGSAFTVRFNREASNPVNDGIRLRNNVWSDPMGTMGDFADGAKTESRNVLLDNNIYWNGGSSIPDDGEILAASMDVRGLVANPQLPAQFGIVSPNWQGSSFKSGTQTIRAEFERLVQTYGKPAPGSPVMGRSDASDSPETDILDAPRGVAPDIGAYQVNAPAPAFRLALFQHRLLGGRTVTLNQIALPHRTGGVVFLSSSEPGVASVPVSVTVPAGQDSVLFSTVTTAVSSERPVRITATMGSTVQTATLTVVPQGVASVNMYREDPKAGDSEHWILMEGPVAVNTPITLSSSRPDLVSFPVETTVVAGSVFARFLVRCKAISEPTPVVITASAGGSQASTPVVFQPATNIALSWIDLDITDIVGIGPVTGTVFLTGPAPAGGVKVSVSTVPAGVAAPVTVTVAENTGSAKFTLQTNAVTVLTNTTIVASYAGVTKSTTLTVRPPGGDIYPASIWFASPVTPPAGGLQHPVAIFLSGPAGSGGVPITFSSNRPDLISFPAGVVVPAGSDRMEVSFRVAPVSSLQSVVISATGSGVTVNRTLAINPGASTPKSIYPTSIWFASSVVPPAGGLQHPVAIFLSGSAGSGGVPITFSSNRPALISFPAGVVVPAGSDRMEVSFRVAPVSSSQSVVISATGGGVTVSRTLIINPSAMTSDPTPAPAPTVTPVISALTVPSWVKAGIQPFTVVISAPAPVGGYTVWLSTKSNIVTIPALVIIPAGATQVTGNMTISSVTVPQIVVLSAVSYGTAKNSDFTVIP
jgi:hypothetical protein